MATKTASPPYSNATPTTFPHARLGNEAFALVGAGGEHPCRRQFGSGSVARPTGNPPTPWKAPAESIAIDGGPGFPWRFPRGVLLAERPARRHRPEDPSARRRRRAGPIQAAAIFFRRGHGDGGASMGQPETRVSTRLSPRGRGERLAAVARHRDPHRPVVGAGAVAPRDDGIAGAVERKARRAALAERGADLQVPPRLAVDDSRVVEILALGPAADVEPRDVGLAVGGDDHRVEGFGRRLCFLVNLDGRAERLASVGGAGEPEFGAGVLFRQFLFVEAERRGDRHPLLAVDADPRAALHPAPGLALRIDGDDGRAPRLAAVVRNGHLDVPVADERAVERAVGVGGEARLDRVFRDDDVSGVLGTPKTEKCDKKEAGVHSCRGR